jgi:hypothetical protein
LAKELRSAGDKDSAAAVKKLRRPSIPAWALNQVARDARDAIATLAQTEADARAAQEKVLRGGDADVLRIATTARRAAIDAVVLRANAVVAASGRAAESYEREIDSAVTAIAGSAALIAELQHGELSEIAIPETDFFGGMDVADLPKPKPKPERKLAAVPKPAPAPSPPKAPEPPKPSPELVKARKRLEKARADAQAAVEKLAAANQALTKAENDVSALE